MSVHPFAAPLDTPWGPPQAVEEMEPGVYWVFTASHGGVMVDRRLAGRLSARALQVGSTYPGHPQARQWLFFEEDCDVRVVVEELASVARFVAAHAG